MDTPIAKYFTKATDRETGPPRRSFNWVGARRAWLKIYNDRLECGDWTIPLSEVKDATLYTAGMFILTRVQVLQVVTKDDVRYQFGLNPWVNITKTFPMPFNTEKVKLKTSGFSVVARMILLIYLGYLLVLNFIEIPI